MNRLRPYQREVARAVMDSVLGGKGLTFTVEMARQAGKNELSAQIEVLILTLFMPQCGNIIKCSPTFKPQTVISMMRLKDRLNDAGYAGMWNAEMGYIVRLGAARVVFLSADKSSNVVGNTAHLLLEVDEAQDVEKDKYSKDFRPMASTTNATTVLYGTPWDNSTLLEELKQTNLELERRDGIRRHFHYDWQEVAKYNPDYLRYVESERERLGENHPLFLTQYALLPLRGGGGFLNPTQMAQLRGEHSRAHHKERGKVYVAGIDLAGEAEGAEDAALHFLKPRRDATVVTIAELDFPETLANIQSYPRIRVVEHYWWVGKPHAELYSTLVNLLKNVWGCKRIVVDATGIGEPVASFLRQALGSRVIPFKFTPQSKSELGFNMLAAVNSGRLKVYACDGSAEYQEFAFELERAKSYFRPSQTMNFYVDPSEGHDDFLMSLALVVRAGEAYLPRLAYGTSGL